MLYLPVRSNWRIGLCTPYRPQSSHLGRCQVTFYPRWPYSDKAGWFSAICTLHTHANLDSDYCGEDFKVTSYHVLCCGVRRPARAMTGAPSDTG